ncbi:ferrous iron transport protein A [Leptolyngbya sp. PCC 6406]|uniref:FeoA family protein n=1 Tax=Leptolyngbya sp. PCC 6406 TaxID=1173264 RepID=UPI0002AC3D54|nr:FeoA family protein [Leptolyngbya sp. PCC 6406]
MDSFSAEAATDATGKAPLGPMTFAGSTADLPDVPLLSVDGESAKAAGGRLPLAMASMGDRLWVWQIQGGHRMVRRLTDLGIVQGAEITLVSRTASGAVVVGLQGCRLGLGAGMAHRVIVTTAHLAIDPTFAPSQAATGAAVMTAPLHLGALAVGQSGHILGYEKGPRPYREKLLSMGLTPGTQFTVTRQAPMGDPIEIEVRGFKLSLRKGEASALKVKVTTD